MGGREEGKGGRGGGGGGGVGQRELVQSPRSCVCLTVMKSSLLPPPRLQAPLHNFHLWV